MRRTLGTLAALALAAGALTAVTPSSATAASCAGTGVPATCTAPTAVTRSVSPAAPVVRTGYDTSVTVRAVFKDPDGVLGPVTFRSDHGGFDATRTLYRPTRTLSSGQRAYDLTYTERAASRLGTRTVTVTGALRDGVSVSGFVAPTVTATYSIRVVPRLVLFRDSIRSSAKKVAFYGYLTGPPDNGGLRIKVQRKVKGAKKFVTRQVVTASSGTTGFDTRRFAIGNKKASWRAVFAGKGALLPTTSKPLVRTAP